MAVCLTLNAVQGFTVRHEQSENKGYTRMHLMRRSYTDSNHRGGNAPERVERDNYSRERFPPYFDTNEGAGIRDDEVYVVAPDRFHKRYYLKHEDDFKRDSFDNFGAVTNPREHSSLKEGSKLVASSRPREYHAKEASSYSVMPHTRELSPKDGNTFVAGAHPGEYHAKVGSSYSATPHTRELISKDAGSFGAGVHSGEYAKTVSSYSALSHPKEESIFGARAHPREYQPKEESNFGAVSHPKEYTPKEKSNFGALFSSGVSESSGESSSHEESNYGKQANKNENGNFGGYFNSREGISWSNAKDSGRGVSSGSGGYGDSGSGGYGGSGTYGDSGSSVSGGYGGSGVSGGSGSEGYGKGTSSNNYGGSHGKAGGYSSGSSGYSGSGYSSSSPSVGSHKGATSYISGLGGNFGGNVNSHASKGEVKGLLQAKYIAPSIKKEKTETHGYHGSDHDGGHEDEHHGVSKTFIFI
jgi:hypothetical protein